MPRNRGLSLAGKARLAARIWLRFAHVRTRFEREPLPGFVARLAEMNGVRRTPHPPATLSNAVYRSLHLGSYRPRCLVNALVLFRLLREQGDAAELVIGLPEAASDEKAHAWVELEGQDVGPPPGKAGHVEIARLP